MDNKNQHHSTRTRDNNLDIYRGCSMIYITCILHNFYGVQHFDSVFTSLLLITMPIVFYISGASYSLTTPKSYPQYLWRRTKRIVFPYYILVALTTIVYLIYRCVIQDDSVGHFFSSSWENGYFNIFAGKLYEFSHVWFIPTYLIIALILPLLGYIKPHLNAPAIYLICIVNSILLIFFPNDVVCYGTFALAGLYYNKPQPANRYIIAAIFACAMVWCVCNGYDFNMQHNKFPPNIMFFAYSGLILSLFMPLIARLCRWLYRNKFLKDYIDMYAQLGLTVYLYHSANVLIICRSLEYLCKGLDLPTIVHLSILISTSIVLFFANIYLSKGMKHVERYIIDSLSHIINRISTAIHPHN